MNAIPPGARFAEDVAYTIEHSLDLPTLRAVVAEHVASAVRDTRVRDARRILIGGSGDSLFGAMSVLPAYRRWTGLYAEAKTAMELARYETALLGPGDLVVSVSNSGSSSRAREVALLAKDRGIPTVGVTGSLTGALATQADHVVHRPVKEVDALPASYGRCFLNMAEYLAVLYALYALALELGVARGRLTADDQAAHLAEIEAAIQALPAMAARIEPGIVGLAEQLEGQDTIWAIGAGPSRGTAQYCAAKFHEQMPINGVACDLEEWAHLEYFLTLNWGARSVVMVTAPTGNSLDRAQEMVTGITGAGGRAIVIAEGPLVEFPPAFARVDLGFPIDEMISPLTYHLPAQLLVLHMAARFDVPHIPLRRHDGTWLIAKGVVRQSAEGLA